MGELPFSRSRIAHADCLEWLSKCKDNIFHSCVTDPPYEIAILGQHWDKTGVAHAQDTWKCILRVLRPGALLAAFSAPKVYHRLACAIEDAGFDLVDMWPWLKGGANMPKGGWCAPAIDKHLGAERKVIGTRMLYGTAALSVRERGGTHSVGVDSMVAKKEIPITESATSQAQRWDGWAWQLKPSHEPVILARKPFDGSGVESLLKWGCGALNVMGCSVPRGPGNSSWPPNVGLTPESAFELSLQSGETKCASNKKPTRQCGHAFHGNGSPQVWAAEALNKGDSGTAERYFPKFKWCRKANKIEKLLPDGTSVPKTLVSVKPEPLIEWWIKLTTPVGGDTLDPFCGSGTSLVAASRLGVNGYGIEQKLEHYEFAKKRSGAEDWTR